MVRPSALTDPLPTLCSGATATYGGNGNLTLDGDIDGDDSPDITLDGASLSTGDDILTVRSSRNTINGLSLTNKDRGIVVFHTGTSPVTDNRMSDNIVTGGAYGIVVEAGEGTTAGAISKTTLRGNTISGSQ